MKKQTNKQSEEIIKSPSAYSEQIVEQPEEQKSTKYVVVRNGFRVSDQDYLEPSDPFAIKEKEFWKIIADKHSYGESVEIVKYESKKHRVW